MFIKHKFKQKVYYNTLFKQTQDTEGIPVVLQKGLLHYVQHIHQEYPPPPNTLFQWL